MGKPVGLTALAVAGEDPVQILPVLIDAGHGPVFKAGAIGKRQNDHVAAQICHVQLVGQLNCCLDPHILGIVDPGGDQHGRPGLFTAQQDMRDMQLRTFHMNMVFDGFSGHELMSGDHFYAHSKLLAPGFFIPYHRRCTSHKPPGGIFLQKRSGAAVQPLRSPSGSLFSTYLPDFCPKSMKKPLLPLQTKEVSHGTGDNSKSEPGTEARWESAHSISLKIYSFSSFLIVECYVYVIVVDVNGIKENADQNFLCSSLAISSFRKRLR